MIYNPPQGSIEDADARYVNKSGDTLSGGLNWGESAYSNSGPDDVSQALAFYDHTGNGNDLGVAVESGSLNFIAVHNENQLTFRVGAAEIAKINKTGLRISKGAVTLLGDPVQPLEAATKQYVDAKVGQGEYLPLTGGKVTGELEVEGSLHIHGDGDVDTPKLIIKDQDSDERYLLRTEYVPPVGSASSATVGDVKSAFLATDHSGWILLDGRAITGLTATQQTAATGLGFATNLPNAAGVVLMQGGALGAVTGSMSRTLTENQMPRHFHPVPAITNDQGVHGFGDMVNPDSGRAYPLTIMRGSAEIININNQNPGTGHMPNYGRTMEDAGNDEPLDITPKSLAVNQFVYLGA